MIRGVRSHTKRLQRFLLFTSCSILALLSFSALPGNQPPALPKLVIVIVVDQMRADYLTRFQDLFPDGGFLRLMRGGAFFTNCNYAHVPTVTAPGHSVVLSGVMPGRSGIVSNEWYDLAQGKSIYCVSDTAVHGLGIDSLLPAGRMSPHYFRANTVGDQLRVASPSSKVIGIAVKDRGAILLAGQHPTSAYWFDADSGHWITSSYYCSSLPAWVQEYNNREIPSSYFGQEWTKLLPDSAYARSGNDSARGEGVIPGESQPVFPHRINDLGRAEFRKLREGGKHRFDGLLHTPYGNEMTLDLAMATARAEQLGNRGVTDLLAISLSPPDYCGHTFGPDSHEVEDLYLRLDRQVAAFCTWVDSVWGMQNVVMVLTADHGVVPLPEQAPVAGARRVDPGTFVAAVKKVIGRTYGYDEDKEGIIRTFSNDYFYLDSARIRRHGIDVQDFERAVRTAALEDSNIAACYVRASLLQKTKETTSTDPYLVKLRNGFEPSRSGHVAVALKKYLLFSDGSSGTSHGTGYPYDTHVPLLIAGAMIRPGTVTAPCTPNDIAPTLCALLGLEAPQGCAGRILERALKSAARSRFLFHR